jgi:outer membrane protein OmpU|tara:strand:+ start:1753 stop:2757 length:1005 start_codon:yes stop_codon:yes gene_type:complete
MNKLTKLGVSALCGSLAAVSSANAGSLSASGGVDMTWISMDDEITGNPIGIGSNYTLSGSGELDNGWTVGLDILMTNKNTYSNTNVSVTIPALGDFVISNGVSGSGIDRMDDKTPNVWEEAYATGLSTGINTVAGASAGTGIEWTPNMLPDGLTARIHYSPNAGGSNINDKASGGQSTIDSGYDITLEIGEAITGMAGLNIYGGMSEVTDEGLNNDGDREEQTIGFTYAMGGLTVGYQWSEEDLGVSSNEQEYENTGYGITFAINDDLSVGYNHYESEQTSTTNVTAEATSAQVAYSMGGASIRIAEGSADNMDYNTGAIYDRDNTVISVALAF